MRCCSTASNGNATCPAISPSVGNGIQCVSGRLYAPDFVTGAAALPSGAPAVPGSTVVLGNDGQWHLLPSTVSGMTSFTVESRDNAVTQGTATVANAENVRLDFGQGFDSSVVEAGSNNIVSVNLDLAPWSSVCSTAYGTPIGLNAAGKLVGWPQDVLTSTVVATAAGKAATNTPALPTAPQFQPSGSVWQSYGQGAITNPSPCKNFEVNGFITGAYDLGKQDASANRLLHYGIGTNFSTAGVPAWPSAINYDWYVGALVGGVQAERQFFNLPIHAVIGPGQTFTMRFGWSIWVDTAAAAGLPWFAGTSGATLYLWGKTYE